MKNKTLGLIFIASLLTACGGDEAPSRENTTAINSSGESDTTHVASQSTKSIKGHYFEQPYQCTHEKEITSKRTEESRTVNYTSFYSPQKGWRIDLKPLGYKASTLGRGGIAILYTPSVRYEGKFNYENGLAVNLRTAWPQKDAKPDVAVSNLSLKKKKNCSILDDASIFELGDLDTLKVMGQ